MAKYWDLDRLMSDANAFDVAERIGIRKKRAGSTYYIECVSGTHSETRLNHCQIFRDGCHCYSCGASHNTYGMVKEYYSNVVGRSLDHDEICSIIADTCGGEDRYIIRDKDANEVKKPFPLTEEELDFIGLAPKSTRARAIVSYSDYKTEEIRELCDDGYVKTKPLPPMNIYVLFRENEALFWLMVKGKISERIVQARAGYKRYKTNPDKDMVQIFIDLYNDARKMEEKFFPSGKQKAVS